MIRLFISAAAVNGFIAVALGAFSKHFLGDRFSAEALGWIETGVRYEMWHALALLAVAWLTRREIRPSVFLGVAGWAFLLGTIMFSGLLYAMAITNVPAIGQVVPLGGVAFLIGWGSMFFYGFRPKWE